MFWKDVAIRDYNAYIVLFRCVKMADVLKPGKHAAQEMVSYLASFAM